MHIGKKCALGKVRKSRKWNTSDTGDWRHKVTRASHGLVRNDVSPSCSLVPVQIKTTASRATSTLCAGSHAIALMLAMVTRTLHSASDGCSTASSCMCRSV